MNLDEICKNIDKIVNKQEAKSLIDKYNLIILNTIKNDSSYYKDKPYVLEFIKNLNKK